MHSILEEIAPETAAQLAALAKASGKSVDEYLKSLLPAPHNALQDEATIGQRLEQKGLIGLIDSTVADPTSPPRRTAFGQLVAKKLIKQGINYPQTGGVYR